MVFFGVSDGRAALFRADSDGGNPQVVAYPDEFPSTIGVSSTSYSSSPSLSPDGYSVAWYTSAWPHSGSYAVDLYVGDLRTGYEHRIATFDSIGTVEPAHWSPDGRSILLTDDGSAVRFDAITGARRVLPLPHWPVSNPAFLPNGRDILYLCDGGSICESDGSGSYDAVPVSDSVSEFAVSHDGRRIAYTSFPDYDSASLKVANLDGSEVRILDPNKSSVMGIAWFPDGKSIAYQRSPAPCCHASTDGLMVIAAEGGTPSYLLRDYQIPGAPSWRQSAVDDLAAYKFQPLLLFDKGEKWRPLNVERFFGETRDSVPFNHVCSAERQLCGVLDATGAALREFYTKDDARIEFGTFADSGSDPAPDDYRSPDPACVGPQPGAVHEVLDCNEGPATAIYVRPTHRSTGYSYLDYWFFYRNNEFVADNHAADWEEVTVAPSLSNGDTFDWVAFHQHNVVSTSAFDGDPTTGAYLRELLDCDAGGAQSCGTHDAPSGRRIRVYVAGGSHASYPTRCDDNCTQRGPGVIEGDHGGQVAWGGNHDVGSLVTFPEAVGWGNPASASWVDWPGAWGDGIASPGVRSSFRCPWRDNVKDGSPAVGCSARSKREVRVGADVSSCAPWYASGVVAAACTPSDLRRAVRSGRIGDRGPTRLRVRGQRTRTGAGVGIAQASGAPLRRGSRVVVRGSSRHRTQLMLVLADRGGPRRWFLRLPRRSTEERVVIEIVSRQGGIRPTIRQNHASAG